MATGAVTQNASENASNKFINKQSIDNQYQYNFQQLLTTDTSKLHVPLPIATKPQHADNPITPLLRLIDNPKYDSKLVTYHTFSIILSNEEGLAELGLPELDKSIHKYGEDDKKIFSKTMYRIIKSVLFNTWSTSDIAKEVEARLAQPPNFECSNFIDIYIKLVVIHNDKMLEVLKNDSMYSWIVSAGPKFEWKFWALIDTPNGSGWWPCILHILFQKRGYCELINVAGTDKCITIDYNKLMPFAFDPFYRKQNKEFMSTQANVYGNWVDAIMAIALQHNMTDEFAKFFDITDECGSTEVNGSMNGRMNSSGSSDNTQRLFQNANPHEYGVRQDLKQDLQNERRENREKMIENKKSNSSTAELDGFTFDDDENSQKKRLNDLQNTPNTESQNQNDNNMQTNETENVLDWFKANGFTKYVGMLRPKFMEDEMCMRGLRIMNLHELKEYGIKNFYDRKIILSKLNSL